MNLAKLHYPSYATYKKTDIPWLEEIPSHWELRKLKYLLKEGPAGIKIGPFGSAIQSKIIKGKNDFQKGENCFKIYGQAHAIAANFSIGNKYIGQEDFERLKTYEVFPGDMIITMMGTIGKVEIIPKEAEKGIIDSHLIRISSNDEVDVSYLKRLLNDSTALNLNILLESKGSIMQGLNSRIVKALWIPLPPKSEQIRMTEFLDRKITFIDQAIAQKEKMIQLLEEYKHILIQKAITQGLEAQAPMKDTGIPWLAKIPAHWELKKVKYLFKLVLKPAPKDNHFELLSIYTDIGVRPRKDLQAKGNKASTTDGYWLVEKGDFIVNKLLAWMGAIGLSQYEGVTSPAYDILRATLPIEGSYYHYLFRMPACQAVFKKHSKGIMEMRLRLYFDEFGNIKIPYPPPKEQSQIAQFLDEKIAEIEAAQAHVQKEISQIQEYEQALIDTVLKGKIKV